MDSHQKLSHNDCLHNHQNLEAELEMEVKNVIKEIFPENPDTAANKVKITKPKSQMEHQYQFHCSPLAKVHFSQNTA